MCILSSTDKERQELSVGTASLLDYLSQETNDSAEFHLCFGSDAFCDLVKGKWNESQRVLDSAAGIVVVHRASATNNDKLLEESSASSKHSKAQMLNVDGLSNVSSSQVRECTSVKQLENLVVPKVRDYIQTNSLYSLLD
jgi:nicotinic acid mononucleotide adenylyltransferase